MAGNGRRRGFALCLDGENLELLERFAGSFRMPVISRMLRDGRAGLLDPWINPLTPPSWTSFLTGNWFPRHGVHGFIRHDPRTGREALNRHSHIRGDTFLESADRQGFRVLSLNMPMTYPPPRLERGSVVTGFDTPGRDAEWAWPAALKARLEARIPGFECLLPRKEGGGPGKRLGYLRTLVERVRWRREALEEMLRDGPFDLMVVQVQETDMLHHAAWDLFEEGRDTDPAEAKALREVYEGVDALAGRVEEAAGPGAIGVLVSDHGGCAGRWVVQVNNLLAAWGYARPLEGADGSLARPDEVGRGLKTRIVRRVRHALGRPASDEQGSIGAVPLVNREIQLRREETRCYLGVGDHVGLIYRGSGAPLSPDEVEGLAERLRGLRLPDGDPVLRGVHRGEEVFPPGCGEEPPLLVLETEDGVFLGRRTGGEAFQAYPPTVGSHRRHGMICWTGDAVAPGRPEEPTGIVSVLPTLLTGVGIPVPAGIDGTVDGTVFRAPVESRADPTARAEGARESAPATEAEERELRNRLEDLGYMG